MEASIRPPCESMDSSPPAKPRRCENCCEEHHALQPFRVEQQGTLWRCNSCGLFQRGVPVPSRQYDLDYHAQYLRSQARKVRTAVDRLDQIRCLVRQPSPRLLDIGSSIGAVLEAAGKLGWRAYGVDVSRDAVGHCRDRGQICHHYDGFRLPFPSKFFDVVTAWHVVEHVPCVRTALAEWHRVLRPGGLVAIETPAADCWKVRFLGSSYRKFWPAEHTYAFTRDTLAPFLWDTGFELLGPRIAIPGGHGPSALYSAFRRLHLGMARCVGASKSFTIFARRIDHRSLDLPRWRV